MRGIVVDEDNGQSEQPHYLVGTVLRMHGDKIVADDQYDLFHSLHVGGWASLRDLAEQMLVLFANSGILGIKEPLPLFGDFRLQSLELAQCQQAFLRSQRTSCMLIGWAILEALANFMAEMTIAISERMEGAPECVRAITPQERDFLREEQTYFDPQKFQTRIRSSNFVSTLEKLTIVPRLLGSVKGIEFQLDRGGRGWHALTQAKRTRDLLTHPKLCDVPLNAIIHKSIAVAVHDNDIANLVNGLAWYATSLWPLIESTFAGLFIGHLQLIFFNCIARMDKIVIKLPLILALLWIK
jgi:hypothetical protein